MIETSNHRGKSETGLAQFKTNDPHRGLKKIVRSSQSGSIIGQDNGTSVACSSAAMNVILKG
jgi:hypothetical protein